MNENLSEDEQVEALKKWWRENGKAIIGGAVFGLAVVFGWQGWDRYTEGHAARASTYFDSFTATVERADTDTAIGQGRKLISEFADTHYAAFTALELAKIHYAANDKDAAAGQLQWVLDHVETPALKAVARLRLARLRLDQGDLDAASALAGDADGEFLAEFKLLEGDIAHAREDLTGAATAYQEALQLGVDNPELVQMKLADLGIGPSS